MGLIIVLLTGVLVYVVSKGGGAEAGPPSPARARSIQAGGAAAVSMPPATAVSALTSAELPSAPDEPRARDDAIDASGSLEDMIAAAMPAVVAIQTDSARGSGFFVKSDTLVTNAHVVRGSSTVVITFSDGRKGQAAVVSVPQNVDLALLRAMPGSEAAGVLDLASTAGVRPGQEVVAIGSALGVLQNTVTRGIVSALRQDNGVMLLQTDAAINPGNSGGPLLDRSGRVVGVNTMKVGSAASIGFALAADHVRALLDSPANSILRLPGSAESSGNAPFAAMPGTGPDDAHARSLAAYELALRSVAAQSDQIDVYWERFKHACNAAPTWRAGDREWIGFWTEPPDVRANVVDCRQLTDDLLRATSAVRTRITTADEAARRAGIYPGEARDLRHKYRLDWDGWDR
jgi:S1-C subfamily serine protease